MSKSVPHMIGDTAALFTVSRILSSQRLIELRKENEKYKQTIDSINRVLQEKCESAEDLVWFARHPNCEIWLDEQDEFQGGCDECTKVVKKWPSETKELYKDRNNWEYGFNSGVLGVRRMIKTVLDAHNMANPDAEDDIAREHNAESQGEQAFEPCTYEKAYKNVIDGAISDFPFLDL
jgi:hypothetical protein